MEWPMKRRYAEFSGEKHSTGALFRSNFTDIPPKSLKCTSLCSRNEQCSMSIKIPSFV